MINFHKSVNESNERRGIISKASEACDVLKVLASPTLVLNISDGHNHGVLNVNEDIEVALTEQLRETAQANYVKAMAEVREAVT